MPAIYDVDAAIKKPNMLAAVQQGHAFGTQQRLQREHEQRQNLLAGLTPAALDGDPDAQAQMYAQDPARAQAIEQGADNRLVKLRNIYNNLDPLVRKARQSGDFSHVNGAMRAYGPWLTRVTGKPMPEAWVPGGEMDSNWDAFGARVSMAPAERGNDGKVVGNALVDPQTGRVIYQGPEVPVNAQIVQVPDGNGGTISMMWDPRTRQLSDLPAPNGGPRSQPQGAPQPAPAQPIGTGQPIGGAVVDGSTGQTDPAIAALPQDQQQAAFRLAAMGRPFHVKGGRVIEGESQGLRPPGVPQPPNRPLPSLSEWGGGDERLGYTPPKADAAPSGYRYRPDGGLEAIPGGPADKPGGGTVSMLTPEEVAAAGFPRGSVIQRKPDGSLVKVHSPTERDTNGGKALPGNIVTQLTEDTEKLNTLTDLAGTFRDDFAGNVVGGGLESFAGRLGGERVGLATQGQAEWWQQYDRYKNVIRNELFGSALTPSEQAAFEAADITPNMDPQVVKSNLARQTGLIERVLQRRAAVWEAQGYNPSAVTAATRAGVPSRAAQDMSDDELKRELGL